MENHHFAINFASGFLYVDKINCDEKKRRTSYLYAWEYRCNVDMYIQFIYIDFEGFILWDMLRGITHSLEITSKLIDTSHYCIYIGIPIVYILYIHTIRLYVCVICRTKRIYLRHCNSISYSSSILAFIVGAFNFSSDC